MNRIITTFGFICMVCITSCTNLYMTTVRHNLPTQVKGKVWVARVYPPDNPGATREKELFYDKLATIGLARSPSMKDADWCLFYTSILNGSEISGYTARMVTDSMATVSPDRIYTQVLEADLVDSPGKPARWKAQVIASTAHLSNADTQVMIKDALDDFPGPTYQKREKWR